MALTVIHASDFSSPYGGNFVASLKRLHDAASMHGVRSVLVFPEPARNRAWFGELREGEVPVRTVSASRSFLDTATAMIAVAKREGATIIHTHFTRFDLPALFAKELMRLGGREVRIIWHVHSGFGVQRSLVRMAKDTVKWKACARRVSAVIVVSDHVRTSLVDRGVDPEKIRVVHNGVDANRLRAHTLGVQSAQNDPGANDGDLVLFMHGWDPIVKGVDIAVEALRILRSAGKRATLLVSGNDSVRQEIEHMVENLPADWVRVVPQIEDVGRYYASASVFVSASRSEGFSYSILEALSMGVPVAASRIAGTDWASTIPSTVVFDAESPADMARAVMKVVAWNPCERKKRCDAGAAVVNDLFGLDRWANKIISVYTGDLC